MSKLACYCVVFSIVMIGVKGQNLESMLSVLYDGADQQGTNTRQQPQQNDPSAMQQNDPSRIQQSAVVASPTTNDNYYYNTRDSMGYPYEWGLWGEYSRCSVSCGTGEKRRQRSCFYYENRERSTNGGMSALLPLLIGGSSSTSSLLALSLLRNNGGNYGGTSNSVNGLLGGLENARNNPTRRQGIATLTSGSPGSDNSQTTNPNPQIPCIGSDLDVSTCYQPDCPATLTPPDKCLSTWGSFGQCSTTCGKGLRFRSRICKCSDSVGRMTCTEPLTESKSCNSKKRCGAAWGDWGPYGRCSTTCGSGTKRKFRICGEIGKCVGKLTEVQTCQNPACPTAPPVGIWGDWGTYGACTTTCGPGTKSRYRICVGLGKCSGSMVETTSCGNIACPTIPPVGQWGVWGPYSTCTNTCQSGVKTRVRVCMGIGKCNGRNMETLSCGNERCPPDQIVPGFWSSFGQWGECRLEVGGKVCYEERYRSCIRGRCIGSPTERRVCTTGPCAEPIPTVPVTTTANKNQAACDASFPEQRRDCGYAGITREECWNRGCCFSDAIYDVNWCFFDDFSGRNDVVQPKTGS